MGPVDLILAQFDSGDKLLPWFVIAAILLTVVYTISRRRKKKDPLSSNPRPSLAAQRQVEEQMQNLLVEFANMARQMSAQLDSRSAKLEVLLKEADERLATMEAALGAQRDAPAALKIHREEEISQPAPPPTADDRHAEIYALADQGQSAPEIARQLNRPNGEIELILALRRG